VGTSLRNQESKGLCNVNLEKSFNFKTSFKIRYDLPSSVIIVLMKSNHTMMLKKKEEEEGKKRNEKGKREKEK